MYTTFFLNMKFSSIIDFNLNFFTLFKHFEPVKDKCIENYMLIIKNKLKVLQETFSSNDAHIL